MTWSGIFSSNSYTGFLSIYNPASFLPSYVQIFHSFYLTAKESWHIPSREIRSFSFTNLSFPKDATLTYMTLLLLLLCCPYAWHSLPKTSTRSLESLLFCQEDFDAAPISWSPFWNKRLLILQNAILLTSGGEKSWPLSHISWTSQLLYFHKIALAFQ